MTITIVPGNVVNHGIGDKSRKSYDLSLKTYPAHFPVFSLVTPKGELGQKYINIGDFTELYGDVQNIDTPYYNVISRALVALAAGGQSTIGVRRVVGNTKKARWCYAIGVKKGKVDLYKRDGEGKYLYDEYGDRIPTGVQIDGYILTDIIASSEPILGSFGAMKPRETTTGDDETYTIYPIMEMETLIGDEYNRSCVTMGIPEDQDYASIAKFVNATGVYPFQMALHTMTSAGVPVTQPTLTNQNTTTFTLFDCKNSDTGVRYSLKHGLGAYTGKTSNRKVKATPAPFNETYVYTNYIEKICKLIDESERKVSPYYGEIIENVPRYKQLNLLTQVDHNGVPYYSFVKDNPHGRRYFEMKLYMKAFGGISPFFNDEGKPFVDVEDPTVGIDPDTDEVTLPNMRDAWKISQALILADLQKYRKSLEINDWVRNRQSMIYDLGYNNEIKDELVELLNTRKDQVAILHASFWLENNTIEERYSLANKLATKLRLKPESAKHGTPSCRATISLWDGLIIGEETGEKFPVVIDLAHKFAQFGGNSEGNLLATYSPDHDDNRNLTLMYNTTVDLEADVNAANNFDLGCNTLRPRESDDLLYRPALPTVSPYSDSVLKDFITVFTCVSCEKIMQDTWPTVSGDTTLESVEYCAKTKDLAEKECRRRLGGMFKDILIQTYYNDTSATDASVMQMTGHILFRKGKYMMEMDVLGYNEANGSLEVE